MRPRALGALAIGLLAVTVALSISYGAGAATGGVEVTDENDSVVQGDTVHINAIFGSSQDSDEFQQEKRIHVTCDNDFVDDNPECPVWSTTVTYDSEQANCRPEGANGVCEVAFPDDFPGSDDDGDPSDQGEPVDRGDWLVGSGTGGSEDTDTFTVHFSTAYTCHEGFHRRGEALLVATSGHAAGTDITVQIVDENRNEIVYENTRESSGPSIPYDFVWRPPLDYPLGVGDSTELEVRVNPNPGALQTETVELRPGMARPTVFFEPGRNQPVDFERTESVLFEIHYRFDGRPPGCNRVPTTFKASLTDEQVGDSVGGIVNKITDTGVGTTKTTTDSTQAAFFESISRVAFNYTIPRDAEATGPGTTEDDQGHPTYEIELPETELEDGNLLEGVNSENYTVSPYTITPEFVELQEDVERLETARTVVNLTYADGSPFTPNDTDQPVRINFGPEDEDSDVEELELEHQGAGRWTASFELSFNHTPLGEYTWRVLNTQDNHGRDDRRNEIERTVSRTVEVVGARPIIDFQTHAGGERVNGTERTRTVHVTLNAEYKNGVPLTEDNVDEQTGGIQLNVHKRNEFGRTVASDSFVMTPVDSQGNWVRSFKIGRTAGQAPAGNWSLEVVASDDRDPPNVNRTRFGFEVEPAELRIGPRTQPPPLVDESESVVEYEFRITYPDGSLLTERLVDDERGGDIDVRLERIQGVGQQPAVERTFDPRSRQGGTVWGVTIDSDKIVSGNHYFNVSGRDIHGNTIGPQASSLFTVVFNGEFRNSTTPVCPQLGPSERCEVSRGENVISIFPGSDGDTGFESDRPTISVLRKVPGEARWLTHRADVYLSPEEFQNRTDQDVGNNHAGLFETGESTPQGRYQLFVQGRAQDDTGFIGFSQPFNVTPITVDRDILQDLPDTSPKQEPLTALIESNEGDVVDLAVAHAGSVSSRAIRVTPTTEGTFVEWTPDRTTPTGPARIQLEGRDVFGNPFEVTLGPVDLQPLDIDVSIASPPDPQAPRGLVTSMVAEMTYEDGSTFRPVHGEPEVAIRDATGERVDTGDARFTQGRWTLTWRPAPDLATGRYVMEVTGRDGAGNRIETVESRPIEVIEGRVLGDVLEEPSDVRRGGLARTTFDFATGIEAINVTVTTGTTVLGPADIRVDEGTVNATFATTRTTELVEARFRVDGRDAHGNDLAGETQSFQIDPMLLNVRFVRQPPNQIPAEDTVVADFVVEYPDGSRMAPSDGQPLVGLFSGGNPQGTIEDVRPREDNPTIWRISWEPPDDIQTGVPFNFGVSAIDRDQNEAPPVSSNGFLVTNAVVPDYLPTPGPGLPGALAAALAATGLAARAARTRCR